MHGLLESERDGYLRFYMQNRFEFRPDIALDLTLREYNNLYTHPKKPQPEEHRDLVLEILSGKNNRNFNIVNNSYNFVNIFSIRSL